MLSTVGGKKSLALFQYEQAQSSDHLFVIYSNAKESCRQRSEETNKHVEWAWVFQIDAGISHQRTGMRRGILIF